VVHAKTIKKTSGLEIFGCGAIAMKKDNGRPFAPLKIMQTNT
jgi:hypothetical protein